MKAEIAFLKWKLSRVQSLPFNLSSGQRKGNIGQSIGDIWREELALLEHDLYRIIKSQCTIEIFRT